MVKQPLISKIQKYSTKDGPGIRTTVFFLGCNLKCLWCSNPELMTEEVKVLHYVNKCQKCGYCVSKSEGSIIMKQQGIEIDRAKCCNLEMIALQCPYDAYEVVGRYYSSKELVDLLLKDEVFYRKSGGGVTFSGGEAALYPKYILEVAKNLKEHNIHLALDTAGLVSYKSFEMILPYIDLFLFDIKAYDSDLHIKTTGVDNKLILDNIKKLSQTDKDIIVRLVLVPKLNDDIYDLKKRLDFIEELGIKHIEFLYYHKFGLGKYLGLDKKHQLKNIELCSKEYKKEVERLVKNYSFNVTFSE